MSLVTLIRDYVDVANSSEQLNGFSSIAYYTLGFLFSILKQIIVNFCTFQWIRDFSYFSLTPPMLFSSFANINISERFLGNTSIEHQSLSNLVAFSETNFLSGIGLIFLGFFNGCFTSMHISATNLVTIQRLLVQGVPAGLCSALGTAIGQCFFLACVHFGFRGLLFPWLTIEPLPFLLGMGILLAIASNSAQDRRTPTIQWSAKSFLLTYTFTSLALAWCEQTALFQLMGNLSFGAEPTLLETTPSFETIETIFGNIQQIIKNGSYLLAFFLGNFLGTFFLAYALQRLLELLLSLKGIPIYYGLIKEANLPLATLIFAFGFGSLPYYGFDYLITKGFGFIPQEQLFQQTLFSPVNLVSKTSQTKEPTQGRLEDQLALLFTLEGEKNKSFVVDTTPFDDGQYLKTGQKRPQAFEDLNYRGEHLWTNRLSRISNIREQANQTQSSFLGPVFSWMRSFLWGEGPATSNVNNANFNKNNEIESASDPAVLAERWGGEISLGDVASAQGGSEALPWKGKEINENIKRKKELSAEREQLDTYLKEFDRQFDKGFSNFHNAEPISLIEVEDQWQEQRIKKKCYTNPIYTFLLNVEIDSFLGRQPNYHRLSAEEEVLLLKRRQLLSNYYDTLAFTSQIPTSQAFNQLVPKSYTNAIYNHQFKGTLKIARRLFSIKNVLPYVQSKEGPLPLQGSKSSDLNNFSNSSSSSNLSITSSNTSLVLGNNNGNNSSKIENEKSRILKFDQPLFTKETSEILPNSNNNQLQNSDSLLGKPYESEVTEQKKILFHEELNSHSEAPDSLYELANQERVQRFASEMSQHSFHPEGVRHVIPPGGKKGESNPGVDKNVFLLEQAESLPLYASWDEEMRKLILTNRFQSRIKAGYIYSAGQEFPKTVQSQILQRKDSRSARSLDSTVSFTAWPLPNPLLLRSYTHTPFESETLQKSNDVVINNVNSITSEASASDSVGVKALQGTEEYKTSPFSSNNVQNRSQHDKRSLYSKSSPPNINVFRFVQNFIDSLIHTTFHVPSFASPQNQFLFPTQSLKEPAPNDMVNALLQWQKLIKDNKQLSKEDKQAAKEKVSYWPKNVRRANWSTEMMDNDIEFDEPTENALKKQIILWEFIPPNYGGFIWPGIK